MTRPDDLRTCSICSCEFDIEAEGGTAGFIGILPVAFCPTCHNGVMDFADQMRAPQDCPHCGECIDVEES